MYYMPLTWCICRKTTKINSNLHSFCFEYQKTTAAGALIDGADQVFHFGDDFYYYKYFELKKLVINYVVFFYFRWDKKNYIYFRRTIFTCKPKRQLCI